MHPGPEMAMPKSAIVSLHAHAQRLAAKYPIAKTDLTTEYSVRVRSARKANPPLVAECDAEMRAIAQVPADSLTATLNRPATPVFVNAVLPDLKREWRRCFSGPR